MNHEQEVLLDEAWIALIMYFYGVDRSDAQGIAEAMPEKRKSETLAYIEMAIKNQIDCRP